MTIARQLNSTKFPFKLWNKAGDYIYGENSEEFWVKRKFDSKGNLSYYENSEGYWEKWEWNSKGNIADVYSGYKK